MVPTIKERPFKYVSDLCFSRDAILRSKGPDGPPKAV